MNFFSFLILWLHNIKSLIKTKQILSRFYRIDRVTSQPNFTHPGLLSLPKPVQPPGQKSTRQTGPGLITMFQWVPFDKQHWNSHDESGSLQIARSERWFLRLTSIWTLIPTQYAALYKFLLLHIDTCT
jgi:hypothetical protein